MNAQQLHDYIVRPTLVKMSDYGNYNKKSARLLQLCTYAIESDLCLYTRQISGPASGPGQIEPPTLLSVLKECDALRDVDFMQLINSFAHAAININLRDVDMNLYLETSIQFDCAIMRLQYSMDTNPLPEVTGVRKVDERSFYDYYKRVYNTELGKSTFPKWQMACEKHNIFEVKL